LRGGYPLHVKDFHLRLDGLSMFVKMVSVHQKPGTLPSCQQVSLLVLLSLLELLSFLELLRLVLEFGVRRVQADLLSTVCSFQ